MGDLIEDDEEEDLYSDLPNFKYDEAVDKLQAGNKELEARVTFLEDVLEKQTKELDESRSQCETLSKNISSLLKTAQNEIKRKDNKINELNKTVLELKTEILTLKKRRHSMTQMKNDEPALKQQKLDNTSTIKSTIAPFFCNSDVIENSTNVDESHVPKTDLPEKRCAPEIKFHTLYSKRMYKQICNVENRDSDTRHHSVETENNDALLDNKVEINLETKLENKNIVLPKPCPKESASVEKSDQSAFNIQIKETIVDSLKISNNATCNNNSKPLFDIFKNGSLIVDNKETCLESTSIDVDREEITLVSSSKCVVNKEVNAQDKRMSPSREQSSSDDFCEGAVKNSKCPQENKRTLISRANRSSNFPRMGHYSKDVSIKHHTQTSKMFPMLNKGKVSNLEKTKFLDKTDELSNKVHNKSNEKSITNTKERVNSQFANSYCLKKSKKSVKSSICPISGDWAKKTEAVAVGNLVEMDISKGSTTNSKTEKEELDIMESLFGSPLKWTENSIDDGKPVEKLSPPATAFEDSCSAHIENLKFKETRNNVTEVSETKITELSLTKKFSYTERKCYFQPSVSEVSNELPRFDIKNNSDISLPKDILKQPNITHWPFKKTNSDIPFKNREVTSPTFSSFVNTESTSEACDVPSSLKDNPNTLDINPSTKVLRSPKYNDSVLGQFDDTTQLINALAKDPSKLSPIHTPIKEPKTDSASSKTQSQLAEHCAVKPSTISVKKNSLVPSSTEEKKLIPRESASSVSKKKAETVPKASSTIKRSSKSKVINNKSSATKPLISKVEKKLSIPASVISSVEKKLSFPFSVLSPAEKKVEKKTILLEQPINILCPRKTPRQVGSCKRNILSKKQDMVKDMNKNNQEELNCIKSPSPLEEKTESRFIKEITTSGSLKNIEGDQSGLKNHKVPNNVNSKSVGKTSSKSPSPANVFSKNQRTNNRNSLVSEDRETIPVKTFKNDRSPVNEKIKHSCSRKENVPQRRELKSPIMEKSPLKLRREQRPLRRDFKPEVFKRPSYRRESFKRPNCYFRQSSVERKIAKDWRHSAKSRSFPVKFGNVCENSRTTNFREDQSTFNTKVVDSREGQSICYLSQTPIISRSSRISWSSSTGVVSTKPLKVQPNSELTLTPQPEMKWILRPIDFDVNPPNALKESNIKSVPESSANRIATNSKIEAETSMNKFLQTSDSSLISSEKSSPAKSIVIVAERRPIKFGSNN